MNLNRALPWIAGGGAALAAVLIFERKAKAAPATPPGNPAPPVPLPIGFDPNAFYGERQKVPLAVPSGWRRVSSGEVSALPELRTAATSLRNSPGFTSTAYGTLAPFQASNGKTYATWVEQHYHEPGGPVKPWGLHHGVTLLAQVDTSVLSDEWSSVHFGGQLWVT